MTFVVWQIIWLRRAIASASSSAVVSTSMVVGEVVMVLVVLVLSLVVVVILGLMRGLIAFDCHHAVRLILCVIVRQSLPISAFFYLHVTVSFGHPSSVVFI